jgi:ribulose-phosphate 3-epimerase
MARVTTKGRVLVSASVLDSDLADLSRECRRALKAGADRIHLDVMDGHFVPNITFGPGIIKKLRRIGRQPFDAHLMISEPSRYVDKFIDAGCDSITFHVEVEEPIEPTLRAIRAAGRAAGLAVKPNTPLSALEPYRDLIDIVMIMTVEPGFGGQSFMMEAAPKILPAHDFFRGRAVPGQVHVDGGVNRESAQLCGELGAEVLVVGSVLWKKGHDMGREIRRIKALSDEGYRAATTEEKPA